MHPLGDRPGAVRDAVAGRGSTPAPVRPGARGWRIVADDEVAVIARRARGARAAELFALVTSAEKNGGALPLPVPQHKYLLTEVMARKLVVEIAPLRSSDGLNTYVSQVQHALYTYT